ncbi:hypothetical protein BDV98DRAFT_34534 [Pterulicium gracile]|uniref:Zinc-ribbon 15 domain-containing protein n=1 Tax=Pterulicium gracile TaxID=1884261 RepID=A0A5C3R0K0_9AGAR|nr:hypothetical protein BDV98DRAFT_34534 [Pterula gracilis]
MDDCFCLPIICGCSTSVKPDSDGPTQMRLCPRCSNATVISAKSRSWFELCCVPIIPYSSKHVWVCQTCQWQQEVGGMEPAIPQQGYMHPNQQQQPQWGPPPPQWNGPPQGQYGGPPQGHYGGPPQGHFNGPPQGQYSPHQPPHQQYPPH